MPHIAATPVRLPFNAGLACWEQRDTLAAAAGLLRRLMGSVGRPTDLSASQWGQLFAAAVQFEPDLVLELGRGCGNSTCVFASAAMSTGARVVSLCLSDQWRTGTRPRVAPLVPPDWLARVDAREGDICAVDFDAILRDDPRVLVFWDAHGFDLAEHVLGRLLPALAGREHLVLMHDLSDARFEGGQDRQSYGGHGLWRGNNWSGPRVRLGHVDSAVEQAVAVVDFTSRNAVPLRSAAEDLHGVFDPDPDRLALMQALLGDLFALDAHWFHFSLNERPGPYGFPAVRPLPPPPAAPLPLLEAPRAAQAPAVATPVRRARHALSLEIVITGRSDEHGGPDFVDRLCAAATHNHALLSEAGIEHTFTLVEWNPLPGRPLLAEIVASRLPFWGRCWVVDPEWHARLSANPRLQFMEFFAKNAGLRRARADAVLTTNSDVFLSREIVDRLAAEPLRDGCVYRAVRHDVDRSIDWRRAPERVLADPAHHLRVHELAAPEFANAAGDFLLLTRRTFTALRGFNETVRFAKIHKDAQFCHRAWAEGLRFETIGPIWHIDHDGSYANAGDAMGSPDAPYGPEWDWRVAYRNPSTWGVSAAVPEPGSGPLVWLRHPATHGPLLSVLPAGESAAVAAALAGAAGRFVLFQAPPSVSADDLRALEIQLDTARPRAAVFDQAWTDHPALGRLPADGAPFVCAWDLCERAGDWPELDATPALTFWLRATAGESVSTLAWTPAGARPPQPPPVRAGLEAYARALRGEAADPAAVDAAVREWAAAATEQSRVLASWLAGLSLPAGARAAVWGPDWMTPALIAAARDARLAVVRLISPDARQAGTMAYGLAVRPVEAAALAGVSVVLATAIEAADRERLERVPFPGSVHALLRSAPDHALPAAATELAMLRAAQKADGAAADDDGAADRLRALAALSGPGRWQHAYEAAMAWERRGRVAEALEQFEAIAAGDGEEALRIRACFHAARMHFERGALEDALARFDVVLAAMPDHRRAWASCLEIVGRLGAGAPAVGRVSAGLRERLRRALAPDPAELQGRGETQPACSAPVSEP